MSTLQLELVNSLKKNREDPEGSTKSERKKKREAKPGTLNARHKEHCKRERQRGEAESVSESTKFTKTTSLVRSNLHPIVKRY